MHVRQKALCQDPRVARDTRFHNQLYDAVAKAPRQIAEGFGRFRHKEFANFVRMAKGSESEVLDLLIEARKKGYLTETQFDSHEVAVRRALSAAAGLIRYLESTPDP